VAFAAGVTERGGCFWGKNFFRKKFFPQTPFSKNFSRGRREELRSELLK
jgi:hypothetical protein